MGGGGGGGGGGVTTSLRSGVGDGPRRGEFVMVREGSGKQRDLGSIPLRLSVLFKKAVVCGYCLVTLSITSS